MCLIIFLAQVAEFGPVLLDWCNTKVYVILQCVYTTACVCVFVCVCKLRRLLLAQVAGSGPLSYYIGEKKVYVTLVFVCACMCVCMCVYDCNIKVYVTVCVCVCVCVS